MAWDHLSITKSHLVYIILGGFTSLFMLCSSVIKERMYIGEATVATLCGVIFGPHGANLINPFKWGNTDEITLEFSRIVLVVQCFAVGVELPKFYMEKHWRSVVFLLVPVMAFGWLVTSAFIFLLIPSLNWLDSLVVAACVTATDPVLASSVVGKGKFARRVPKHLRDLLSAESGCNDGMAFPFIYLALYLIQFKRDAGDVTFHWIVVIILYECVFGAIYGFIIGYVARRGIKYAHEHDLIDRESFLSFYFVLSLFCAGSGSILGLDDLLVGFAAGVGFSNDGWFGEKTEESHVSNVIDLLLNLSYFVYLGTIIPWELYDAADIGLTPWRLVVIAIFVIFFRRIPVMMACKPVIPDLKTWREALFAGHFGPIGVGAIFVAILARAELQSQSTIPLDTLPTLEENENALLIKAVWPIVTFLVVASIVVHGSSIAVFTLGKRINTLTITMSYTKDAGEDGPEWLRRLPRISSQSRSQTRSVSSSEDDLKMPFPPGTLPTREYGGFLRRKVDDGRQGSRTSSIASRRRRKKWDDISGPGGPISQSAIFPQRHNEPKITISTTSSPSSPDDSEIPSPTIPAPVHLGGHDMEKAALQGESLPSEDKASSPIPSRPPSHIEVFEEGSHLIIEDQDGEVLSVTTTHDEEKNEQLGPAPSQQHQSTAPGGFSWTYSGVKSIWERFLDDEKSKRKVKDKLERKHEPARAFQYGNTIIVEDGDGEVVKRYELPVEKPEGSHTDFVSQSLKCIGISGRVKGTGPEEVDAPTFRKISWSALGDAEPDPNQSRRPTLAELEDEDDRHLRFRISGEEGERMSKDAFIRRVSQIDPRTQDRALGRSTVSQRTTDTETRDNPVSATACHGAQFGGNHNAKPGLRLDAPLPPTSREAPVVPMARGRAGSSASAVVAERASLVAEASSAASTEPGCQHGAQNMVMNLSHDKELEETPAERRRRELALGMMGDHEDDSDDDNTERVMPSHRRGIRWLDVPDKT